MKETCCASDRGDNTRIVCEGEHSGRTSCAGADASHGVRFMIFWHGVSGAWPARSELGGTGMPVRCALLFHQGRQVHFTTLKPDQHHLSASMKEELDCFRACERFEIGVVLAAESHKIAIQRRGVHFDKNKQKVHGRCRKYSLPALELVRRERIEPSPSLRDVTQFETLSTLANPSRAPSRDTLTRHKNPRFGQEI